MQRVVLRVWLPDRPGALGQVASRIGAVHGDVVGIEILEQGAGRAIDELVVALPDAGLIDLLVREVSQVDGVDIEWAEPVAGEDHDPQLALLEAAADLVEADGLEAALTALCQDLCRVFAAEWAAVVDLDAGGTVASVGEAPAGAWMVAFLEGSRHLDAHVESAADDVAWAELPGRSLALVVGRAGRPLRARERRQLAVLARIGAAVDASDAIDAVGAGGAQPVAQARERSTPRSQVW